MASQRKRAAIGVTGSERAPVPGARVVGPVSDDESIDVTLRLRHARPTSAARVYRTGVRRATDTTPLTREQLAGMVGADNADVEAVETFVLAHGLTLGRVSGVFGLGKPAPRAVRKVVRAGSAGRRKEDILKAGNAAATSSTAGTAVPMYFTDITHGNNRSGTRGAGFIANTGWDACTGLGVPIGTRLLESVWGAKATAPKPKIQRR